MADLLEYVCPDPDCDYVAYIGVVPATRWDTAYLDGDPPEECPECGADMEGVHGDRSDGPERDWEAIAEARAEADFYDREPW